MAELSTKALRELLGNPELVDAVSEPCACGAPRVLSLGLSSFICSDKGCPFRVAARLYAIAERFHVADQLPLSDLEYLCQERYYRSWLDFFTDEWEDSDFEDAHSKLMDAIKAELDTTLVIVLSGFDELSSDQLYALCGDFSTVTDFADALDQGGLMLVAERLGLTEAHLMPAAIHIFNRLSACLGEMLEAEEIFR